MSSAMQACQSLMERAYSSSEVSVGQDGRHLYREVWQCDDLVSEQNLDK